MRVYAVAFPTFAEQDLARISAVRARFDRLATKLSPHVTLVFATEALDASGLARHVAATVRPAPFECVFRATRVEPDPFSGEHCVFLVPDEGAREIVALHDALYTGPLAGELRTDLPYYPHVTIARCAADDEARDVASSIGELGMRTWIAHVQVLASVDGTFVATDAIGL